MPLTLLPTEAGGGADTLGLPAWAPYTPAWTGVSANPALGNGTLQGAWDKIGSLLVFRIDLIIGSTTTLGTGAWKFSLPAGVVAKTLAGCLQTVNVFANVVSAGTWFIGLGQVPSAGTLVFPMNTPHSTSVAVGAAEPVSWAATDELHISGVIEVA